MRKIIAVSLSLLLLLCAVPAVSAERVVATEDDVILLAGSDFQVSNKTFQIEKILNVLEIHGLTRADGAFFVGDYTENQRVREDGTTSAEDSAKGIATLKNLFSPIVGDNMLFTQGNHDHVDTIGLAVGGNNDPSSGKYGVFVINEDDRMEFNWPYSYDKTKEAADQLKAYLDDKVAKGWTKPIFVLNHIGLHWSNRIISQGVAIHANLLVDVLNEAGQKGLNIIYLYGHNHSGGYDDAMGGGAVYFKKGDQLLVPQGRKAKEYAKDYTIHFTYMNAGYIGAYSTTEPTADATVTMSVFLIRGDEVIITRYDDEINLLKDKWGVHNLKSPGVWYSGYSDESKHAIPNTLEYASSRKVTATDDVAVEAPRYSPLEVEEPEESTTTTVTTTSTKQTTVTTTKKETTTKKPVIVTSTNTTAKTTLQSTSRPTTTSSVTTQKSTTTSRMITTTTSATTAETNTTSTKSTTVTESTTTEEDATTSATSTLDTTDATTATTIEHDCVMPEDGEEDVLVASPKPFPIGWVLGIGGGAVLLIGVAVFWWLLKRKK